MLDLDLTPLYSQEGHNLWYSIMLKEYFFPTGWKATPGSKCYIAHTDRLSRCVRPEGHKGPHVNNYAVWDRYPGESRL